MNICYIPVPVLATDASVMNRTKLCSSPLWGAYHLTEGQTLVCMCVSVHIHIYVCMHCVYKYVYVYICT